MILLFTLWIRIGNPLSKDHSSPFSETAKTPAVALPLDDNIWGQATDIVMQNDDIQG